MVLSSQRVDLKDAIYNAVKGKDRSGTANPLVRDGQKLIPSVTRVFSSTRDVYVYLQAYRPYAPGVQPLCRQKKAFNRARSGRREGGVLAGSHGTGALRESRPALPTL